MIYSYIFSIFILFTFHATLNSLLHKKCYIYRISHGHSNKSNKDDLSFDDDKTKPVGSNKKLTSVWRYLIGEQVFNTKIENSKTIRNTSDSVIGWLI